MRKRRRGCLSRSLLWILSIYLLILGVKWGTARLFPMPYSAEITSAASENNISPALLYGLIKAESAFSPVAESAKGAKGLMQLMPETAAECAEKCGMASYDIFAPEDNIRLGAFYLGTLLRMYDGNEKNAVAAYNAGHGRVDFWLSSSAYSADGKTLLNIPFPETDRYVKKVLFYSSVYARFVTET